MHNIKTICIGIFLLLSVTTFSQVSFHTFKVKTVFGDTLHIASLQGKKILVVNTASTGPRADQFGKLKQLANQYIDSNLVIIVFPSNDFNNEPLTNQELQALAGGANFFISQKESVKGEMIAPVYLWLAQKIKNEVVDMNIIGDYQKFLISGDGKLVAIFSGKLSPLDDKVKQAFR